ncbi:hypothetical protein [Chitinophaga sp.]|uniref:OmpP1/FadL family transporter n=1 Tax=Chitinophaga sp. TaxID=1869181 RepID=UPI0031E0AC99
MNKRITFLLIALGVSAHGWAQDEGDALRYSRLTTGGTARTQAIGGAAGSLGGDITASHVNPAGIGFFKTSEVVFTPGFYFRSNSASYLGTNADESKSGAMLGNAGIVFGIPASRNNSKWRNLAFSLDYNRLADFNNTFRLNGVNTTTSYSDRWVQDLNNNGSPIPFDNATGDYPLGASLALNTYLIDAELDPNGNLTGYFSGVPIGAAGIQQQAIVKEKGGQNEFSLALGGNYADQWYMGVSLNFPTLRYERNRTWAEDDLSGDTNNDFSYFEYTENLKTDAVGFNAKLGAIYAPMPSLRIGAAFHTPTWYSMRDQSSANVQVDTEGYQPDGRSERWQSTGDLLDGYPVEYEYNLKTPWRALGSVSYIFGTNADVSQQHGFLTADVEYVNYASAKYKFNKGTASDREFADRLNQSIENMYKSTVNVRVGGEMKFTVLAVRAGFAYYGDPYENSTVDASIKKISGGVGYRNKGFFADLTYVHTLAKEAYQPYVLRDAAVAPATIDMSGGAVMATIGFKF